MSSLIPILIALVGAGAVGALVFVGGQTIADKMSARDALNQLRDYELEGADSRDRSLLTPLRSRVLTPAMTAMGQQGNRFNPPDFVNSVKQKHLAAGIEEVGAVERFLAVRVGGFLLAPVAVLAIWFLPIPGLSSTLLKVVASALAVAVLTVMPSSRLNAKVKARETDIQLALPDTLDLLVICVEAGLGFEQALDRVVSNVPGPLSVELARMMGETAAGASRSDALRNLQERVDVEEVRSFTLALIQADTFGISIGRVLRSQADDMRIRRRVKAQEQAQKAPVKMMLPMVFCIFPSIFIVILGPAMLNIMENFSQG